MSGISFVLNIARGALYAQQQGIAVTSHNIANVGTAGYTRQRLNFENLGLESNASRLQLGMGVLADSVSQTYDRFLTQNIQQKTSVQMQTQTELAHLQKMQSLFNDGAGTGLGQPLAEFWNAWQDVADNPSGIPERTALLHKGEALAERFQTIHTELTRIRAEMNTNLGAAIQELNQLSSQVAELNVKIVASEAGGTTANDLRDRRNLVLEKISGLIGNVRLDNADGSVTVMTTNGLLLADRAQSWNLSQSGDALTWGDLPGDISQDLTGGKIGGTLNLRDEILPEYVANLDELAGNIIQQVNDLHEAGFSLDTDPAFSTGLPFFDETVFNLTPGDYSGAAGYIRLSREITDNPGRVAAALDIVASGPPVVPLPGDNRNALRIADLQGTAIANFKKWTYQNRGADVTSTTRTISLDDYYRTLVGDVGTMTAGKQQDEDFNSTVMSSLNELRDSVSGVNLDEELTELIQLQGAYQAAAKLVTSADELLQTLLQMT
jgi:flagellar hook-associated protein 1 FlgK